MSNPIDYDHFTVAIDLWEAWHFDRPDTEHLWRTVMAEFDPGEVILYLMAIASPALDAALEVGPVWATPEVSFQAMREAAHPSFHEEEAS